MAKASLTMENLYSQIERMKRGEHSRAASDPAIYGNLASLAADGLPKLSGKAIQAIMELMHASYQLGQLAKLYQA